MPLSDQARKLGLHDRQPRMPRYLPEEVESVWCSRYCLPEEVVESVVFQVLPACLRRWSQCGVPGTACLRRWSQCGVPGATAAEEAELAAALALDALFMEEKVDTFMSKVSSYLQGERCPTHRCPPCLPPGEWRRVCRPPPARSVGTRRGG